MSRLSKSLRKLIERRFIRGTAPGTLNEWQKAFCEWNAERLGLSLQQSIERFNASWAALRGGHAGRHFKLYGEVTHDLLRPFAGNQEDEIFAAYRAHAPIHFLRMLAYRIPTWPAYLPELAPLLSKNACIIVDFGCGLAQTSISLASFLRAHKCAAELFLADMPLQQAEFLDWLCRRMQVPMTFAPCTPASPLPRLPRCDLCIATEVFEHLHQPLAYLQAFANALAPGGFLLTNVSDHDPEFLHVSPSLAALREFLHAHDWRELRPNTLFQKP